MSVNKHSHSFSANRSNCVGTQVRWSRGEPEMIAVDSCRQAERGRCTSSSTGASVYGGLSNLPLITVQQNTSELQLTVPKSLASSSVSSSSSSSSSPSPSWMQPVGSTRL